MFGKQTTGTTVHFVWIVDDNIIEKYMYLIHTANTQIQGTEVKETSGQDTVSLR